MVVLHLMEKEGRDLLWYSHREYKDPFCDFDFYYIAYLILIYYIHFNVYCARMHAQKAVSETYRVSQKII